MKQRGFRPYYLNMLFFTKYQEFVFIVDDKMQMILYKQSKEMIKIKMQMKMNTKMNVKKMLEKLFTQIMKANQMNVKKLVESLVDMMTLTVTDTDNPFKIPNVNDES